MSIFRDDFLWGGACAANQFDVLVITFLVR